MFIQLQKSISKVLHDVRIFCNGTETFCNEAVTPWLISFNDYYPLHFSISTTDGHLSHIVVAPVGERVEDLYSFPIALPVLALATFLHHVGFLHGYTVIVLFYA